MSEVLWVSATRFHDWSDRRYPEALLDVAAEAGVVGPTSWVRAREVGPRKPVALTTPGLGAKLLAVTSKRRKILWLEAGGEGWRMYLVVPPFAPTTNRVNGMCIASLYFEGTPFADAAGSDRLWAAFRSAHTPEDTEFAGIHSAERWDELRRGPYQPAVTYDPMFAGVLWATFLGPGHIDQFEPEVLGDLAPPAYEAARVDARGLFLRVSERLGDATSPEVEARMFELTERFRCALKG